ncbi:hypothetical protein BKA65DRAFT_146287 [Rhexocercosporidium sp. MPI-PUGE-AT-0058]|nr:hypothetical protein BKA65DRAFT_146287 [Rhexocercosporidium sp. MPI-PUGE-AT-0058]
MSCNEVFEMPAFDSTPSTPIPGVTNPIDGEILVRTVVEQNAQRTPFDAGELIGTLLSDRPWRFYHVPADQIEPIQSDWDQIRSAPGIHVAGSGYGMYRVAVNESYVPWLALNGFKFLHVDPAKPVNEEEFTAPRNADARYIQDAVRAITSGCPQGLVLAYRNHALVRQKLPIEWTILWRDLSDIHIRTKLAQSLVFLVLGCCDDYDSPDVLALLGKNEAELLQGFRYLYRQLSAYPRNSIANCEAGLDSAQIAAEFHRLSLFRCWLEFLGGKRDCRQHKIDQQYTAIANANIISSLVGIEVLKPFEIFDPQRMLDALSKSPLFLNNTIHTLDVVKMSTQVMARLPFGLPNEYLNIPLEIQRRLNFEQVGMIHAQIAYFYRKHPSLQMPRNNILVLLCWNSITPSASQVLIKWAASIDSWTLYQRLIKDIQDSQSKEQLILTLGALLCYRRLSPPNPNANQPINRSYLADFDAILNFKYLSNTQTVFEHMVLSVLRIFWTVNDTEKMRQFLASVFHIEPLALDPAHEISDLYWTRRVRDGLGHSDVLKIDGLDNLMGGRRGEEAMLEEMATLDHEKEPTMDGDWVLVPQLEESVASLCVSDDKHRMSAFPSAELHLEAYKLVYVCLPKVPPHQDILSTAILPNDSSVVVVRKSYVSTLEQDLDTRCFPYNVEPSREDVELLGSVEAQHRKVDALARMLVDPMLRDTRLDKGLWICTDRVLHLFTTWLGGVVAQSKTDPPAFSEQTRIETDQELGRIQMDGYDFNLYTLVTVSYLGQYAQNLDKLGNLDDILSIVELEDESWELPVRKSYLPILRNKLHEMDPTCIIELGSNPIAPNAKEVEKFGYQKARVLSTMRFRYRAECMVSEAWPKAAAFYTDLRMGLEEEMISLEDGHMRERGTGR